MIFGIAETYLNTLPTRAFLTPSCGDARRRPKRRKRTWFTFTVLAKPPACSASRRGGQAMGSTKGGSMRSCPLVGGRRLIPADYLPTLAKILRERRAKNGGERIVR